MPILAGTPKFLQFHYLNRASNLPAPVDSDSTLEDFIRTFPFYFKANRALAIYQSDEDYSHDPGWPSQSRSVTHAIQFEAHGYVGKLEGIIVIDARERIEFWQFKNDIGLIPIQLSVSEEAKHFRLISSDQNIIALTPESPTSKQRISQLKDACWTDDGAGRLILQLFTPEEHISITIDFGIPDTNIFPVSLVNDRIKYNSNIINLKNYGQCGQTLYWDKGSREIMHGNPRYGDRFSCVLPNSFTPRAGTQFGNQIAIGGNDSRLYLVDIKQKKWRKLDEKSMEGGHVTCMTNMQYQNEALMIVGCDDQKLRIINLKGKCLTSIPLRGNAVSIKALNSGQLYDDNTQAPLCQASCRPII